MLAQDKNFSICTNNFHKYFWKLCFFLLFLTFFVTNAHSQNYSFIQKKVLSVDHIQHMHEGYFLLYNYSHFRGELNYIKKLDKDAAIVKFGKNLDTKELNSFPIYAISNEWKLTKSKISFEEISFVNIEVLDVSAFKYKTPFKILNGSGNYLRLEITREELQQLMDNDLVVHIERSFAASTESPVINHDLSVNAISYAQSQFSATTGKNLQVSIKENLFDVKDIDLINRTQLDSESADRMDQHATTIATLIIGGENSSKEGRGVAVGATAYSSSFLDLLPDPVSYFSANNIFVQNHSYGTQISSEYGVEAAAFDQNVSELTEMIHVFSSGNSGNETATSGVYSNIEGYANLTGNFKLAKNVLVVGATDEKYNVLARSSKGPAPDGRIKPELVAYATQGTSDAAALVSGSALILQDLYLNKYGEYPKASLIKAALIAGAKDVSRKGPDYDSGYGSLNLEQSLDILHNQQFFEGETKSGEIKTFQISIPNNTQEFKVVLSWIDPPASAGSGIALVNDLDILLKKEQDTWNPWVLNTTANRDSIQLVAKRGEDHINNNELISLENPSEGVYIIQVSAEITTDSPQQFSLAYTIELEDQFEWTFPTSEDGFINGNTNIARWNTSYKNEATEIQIKLDNGSWQEIANEFEISDGYSEIDIDEGYSGKGQLKIVTNSEEYVSEEFVIAPQLSLGLDYNCTEEVLISWPIVNNASAYKVYNLGEFYLEPLGITAINEMKITKSSLKSKYLSVVPLFDGIEGEKGLTIDISVQGVGCYFNNFFAFLEDDLQINATLNLSTTRNISKIEFFRQEAGITKLLNTVLSPLNSLQLTTLDTELAEGDVTYFAVISLENGTTIKTNEVNFFIPGDNVFQIFPNPLENGGELTIISKGDDLDFYMFDMAGQRILSDQLIQFNDRLELPRIARGVYLLVAERNGKRVGTKKIIIK